MRFLNFVQKWEKYGEKILQKMNIFNDIMHKSFCVVLHWNFHGWWPIFKNDFLGYFMKILLAQEFWSFRKSWLFSSSGFPSLQKILQKFHKNEKMVKNIIWNVLNLCFWKNLEAFLHLTFFNVGRKCEMKEFCFLYFYTGKERKIKVNFMQWFIT